MAFTEMLTPGTTSTLVQNQVYAIPPGKVYRLSFNDGNTYQTSNDPAFGSPVGAANGTDVARAFIRCTTGNGLARLIAGG